jgi:hypothetical protein
METDLQRLEKLKNKIVGMEMNLSLIDGDLVKIHFDLGQLNRLETTLVENIRILKTDRIVTIASEYKKSTTELEMVRIDILFLSRLRCKLELQRDKMAAEQEEGLLQVKALENVIKSQRVILLFDQHKKRKA